MEQQLQVGRAFRFPHFPEVMWYTAAWGLGQLELQQQGEDGTVLRESLMAVTGYLEEGESWKEIPVGLCSPEGEECRGMH